MFKNRTIFHFINNTALMIAAVIGINFNNILE